MKAKHSITGIIFIMIINAGLTIIFTAGNHFSDLAFYVAMAISCIGGWFANDVGKLILDK